MKEEFVSVEVLTGPGHLSVEGLKLRQLDLQEQVQLPQLNPGSGQTAARGPYAAAGCCLTVSIEPVE